LITVLHQTASATGSRWKPSSSTVLRPDAEVLDELDVAFCLTWGCAEANLRQQPVPGDVRDYVIWERRRALEWLMGDDWDNPSYDT
jgi:Domain of unknown function (DUF4272)